MHAGVTVRRLQRKPHYLRVQDSEPCLNYKSWLSGKSRATSVQISNVANLQFEKHARAVVVADVVEYTRLIEQYEIETHRRFRTLRVKAIDPAIVENVIEKEGAAQMDMSGKIMKGYVLVDAAAINTNNKLAYWINLALDFNPIAKSSKKKKK